ncbi:hypothetical protein ACCO45_012402 [Purpureocillium lilacinum]
MYADESAFIWPPPDGWPTITAASLRGLGKSNDVIELLRHIPYRRVNTEIQSAPYSTFLDWTWVGKCGVQQGDEDWKVDAEGIANYQNVPSTVVGLTEEDYAAEGEVDWRSDGACWSIPDCFEVLKTIIGNFTLFR